MNLKDLQPELGSVLPGRWRLRPTLPGSRVTRRKMQVGDPRMAEMEEQEKKYFNTSKINHHIYNTMQKGYWDTYCKQRESENKTHFSRGDNNFC